MCFLMKYEVLWGSGVPWGPGLETRGAQSVKGPKNHLLFGGHFGIFSAFLQVYFFVYFSLRLFSRLWRILGPKGAQKGGSGRSFWSYFGDGAER